MLINKTFAILFTNRHVNKDFGLESYMEVMLLLMKPQVCFHGIIGDENLN